MTVFSVSVVGRLTCVMVSGLLFAWAGCASETAEPVADVGLSDTSAADTSEPGGVDAAVVDVGWRFEERCYDDEACGEGSWCDPAATTSCDGCRDRVSACRPLNCTGEAELLCDCAKPECGRYDVAIIVEGCWQCVDGVTCGTPLEDDGC